MNSQLPILLFLVPFVTAVSMPILCGKRRSWCEPLTIGAVSIMVVLAVLNLRAVLSGGAIEYALGGWTAPLGIAWLDDPLAAIMALTMSVVALLSLLYGRVVITPSLEKSVQYYTLVLLFISSLIGIVFAADLFNVFVFLEVAALTGYALVGANGGKSLVYAFRYLLLGSFGATLYLLGVSYLYAATGTLNMTDLATRIPDLITSTAVVSGIDIRLPWPVDQNGIDSAARLAARRLRERATVGYPIDGCDRHESRAGCLGAYRIFTHCARG